MSEEKLTKERSLPINQDTIWNFRQNHPELVCMDAQAELGLNDVQTQKLRDILMRRGINKWLFVRRMLITLKHQWRDQIQDLDDEVGLLKMIPNFQDHKKENRKRKKINRLRERRNVPIQVRQQVRALCHSTRLVFWPRNPKVWPMHPALPSNFGCTKPNKRLFGNRKFSNTNSRKSNPL